MPAVETLYNLIAKKSSLMSSIVITARKRLEEKTGFVEEIKKEVDMYVTKRVHEFTNYDMRDADVMVGYGFCLGDNYPVFRC